MTTTKTIRGLKQETWNDMKSEAARRGVTVSAYLEDAVRSAKKYEELIWDHVLNHRKNLTGKEAEAMKKHVEQLRSEKGFRM